MRLALSTGLMLMLCVPLLGDVGREGTGERRAELDRMELMPFPDDAFGLLSDWTAGEPTDLDGKVVLITTFASWNPNSHRALSIAQRLHKRNHDKGLVVVGVHHAEGSDGAPELLKAKKVSFTCGYDTDGKFRERLLIDQDPDFYVIDRAGNLRYADVRTEDVSGAVRDLLEESAEDAESVPDSAKVAAAAAERDRRKTRGLGDAALPGQQVNVAFEAPEDTAYNEADWPRWWVKTEYDAIAEEWSTNAPDLDIPQDESLWIPAPMPEDSGRVKVVYVFDPARPALMGHIPELERLQYRYQRDVDVIGAAINLSAIQSGGDFFSDNNNSDSDKLVRRNRREVERWLAQRGRPLNHRIVLGSLKASGDLETSGDSQVRTRGNDFTVALILSTDGKVRYIGHPNIDSFSAILPRIIDIDPGVQARRKAEEAYERSLRSKD